MSLDLVIQRFGHQWGVIDNRIYCFECGESFEAKIGKLIQHTLDHNQMISCEFCPKNDFVKITTFYTHCRVHHPDEEPNCLLCPDQHTFRNMVAHVDKAHGKNGSSPAILSQWSGSVRYFGMEWMIANEAQVICLIQNCFAPIDAKPPFLAAHLLQKHEISNFYCCDDCLQMCVDYKNFCLHCSYHGGVKCVLCDVRGATQKLNEHWKIDHQCEDASIDQSLSNINPLGLGSGSTLNFEYFEIDSEFPFGLFYEDEISTTNEIYTDPLRNEAEKIYIETLNFFGSLS